MFIGLGVRMTRLAKGVGTAIVLTFKRLTMNGNTRTTMNGNTRIKMDG